MEKVYKVEKMPSKAKFIWKKIWMPIFCILIPLLLSPILLWEGIKLKTKPGSPPLPPEWMQARAAFVILLMALYWITECLPLSVTSILPVALFPLLQVLSSDIAASSYLNSSVLLLLSGCIIALSFEYSNLHTRIALTVITLVGAQIPLLLFGIMMTAMFLSMWMNNTSTTGLGSGFVFAYDCFGQVLKEERLHTEAKAATMGMDIDALSVTSYPSVRQVNVHHSHVKFDTKKSRFGLELQPNNTTDKTSVFPEETPEQIADKAAKDSRNTKIMFLLGIAWASNIGGTGVITGTATNVIAQEEASNKKAEVEQAVNKSMYKNYARCLGDLEIDFLDWMKFNCFPMFIVTILTWAVLLVYFTGIPSFLRFWRKRTAREIKDATIKRKLAKNIELAIRAKLAQLGSISLHEIFVLIIFSCLVTLWVTGGKLGWYKLFKRDEKLYIHDACPSLFLCLFLFVIPKEKKYYKNILNGGLGAGMRDPVLTWEQVETKVPWGPLILIGGGSAISAGIKGAGLGHAIGSFLQENKTLSGMPPAGFMAIIMIIVAVLTTIASNTATAAILSPVLLSLAVNKGIHPKYMLVVPTVSASYAFLLPISTPPNAIVFDKSDMKQIEMVKPGLIVTILSNLALFALVHSYDELIYDFKGHNQACKLA